MELVILNKLSKERQVVATFVDSQMATQVKNLLNKQLEDCGYGTDDFIYETR